MAKQVGIVAVLNTEAYNRKDGSLAYRIVAMDEDGNPTVFYKDSSEGEPKKGDKYYMVIGYDKSLKAIIRYQRC